MLGRAAAARSLTVLQTIADYDDLNCNCSITIWLVLQPAGSQVGSLLFSLFSFCRVKNGNINVPLTRFIAAVADTPSSKGKRVG